ncbi:tRNA nucleotidyltransferase [Psychrobacter aestuarii]|uniref:Multifunctional CCA addition/repair protein n=1 Tax=Psychrobacter aestuarii TaxID=556327 RepID=A0ABN0VWI4_9GAMM|nr:tRNA nucleotidyltransferase [Psychrobacter aestuarii]
MQVYLVGGAVRDTLLKHPVKDKDFVVVGSSVDEMLGAGFLQVGADFPVFLHPKTQQEYALARTERKQGYGYQGFSVHASPDVTLKEDLMRRDLTINAMAIEVTSLYDDTPLTGDVVDYYGGLNDIEQKVLRHVSDAFIEDPLRVLRVARFYSRYFDMGFTIATETAALMQSLSASGELAHLSADRIWQESSRAMMQRAPQAYWQSLYDIGALHTHFSPLVAAWDNAALRHTIMTALQYAAHFSLDLSQRWALLMMSLCPAWQSQTQPPLKVAASTTDSDKQAADTIRAIGNRAKVPKIHTQFAALFVQHIDSLSKITHLTPAEQMALIHASQAHKQPERLEQLIVTQHALQMALDTIHMQRALDSYHAIGMADIDQSLKGPAIGDALTAARIAHLTQHSL